MISLRLKKLRNYSSDSFVVALSRVISRVADPRLHVISFLPDQIFFLCKQDSRILDEQQLDSNRPTNIENFGENLLFNP